MFTSADQKRMLHYILCDVSAAVFFAAFGAVYERFSHEVYSYAMIYAFAVPLVPGALLLTLMICCTKRLPSAGALVLWHAGLAAFTVWLTFSGVLEIYGTTNRLTAVYPAAGAVLTAAGAIAYICGRKKPESARQQEQVSLKK